ncbi:MAG TPA: hypothetical protein VMV07_17585 [Streptosporangiaceae bacterium]|nr:hypothetical protein [Streptosporangiaceae bacterium]
MKPHLARALPRARVFIPLISLVAALVAAGAWTLGTGPLGG